MRDRTIQEDLDILSDWSKTWLLKFNEQKCKIVHIGHNNPNHEYFEGLAEDYSISFFIPYEIE